MIGAIKTGDPDSSGDRAESPASGTGADGKAAPNTWPQGAPRDLAVGDAALQKSLGGLRNKVFTLR